LPRTGLPAELVRRRPDVRRAHHRLSAADKDLAAAVSRQYPRLTLTASLTTTDQGMSKLFSDWARSFAAELAAPLIDAGERSAEVERFRALREQRLYQYGQAILTAFKEVEDALIREKKQRQQVNSLRSQARTMERTVERLRLEYINGSADFLDLLQARTEKQQLRRDLLNARLQRVEYRIALYRALAGGFETGRESGGSLESSSGSAWRGSVHEKDLTGKSREPRKR
jgi:outer membrane protein TolC